MFVFFLTSHQPQALLILLSLHTVISKHLIASFHGGRRSGRKKEERARGDKREKEEGEIKPFLECPQILWLLLISLGPSHLPECRGPRKQDS